MSEKRKDRKKEALKARIATSTVTALWALRYVHGLQTELEQVIGRDIGIRDGVGFTPPDTEPLNRLHDTLEHQDWMLTAVQADQLRAAMPKYAGQILRTRDGKRRESA